MCLTTQQAAERQASRENLVRELTDALQWAMHQGRLSYFERNKSNAEYCDAIDRARDLLKRAKEQQ